MNLVPDTLRRLYPGLMLLDDDGADVLRSSAVPEHVLSRPLGDWRLAIDEDTPGAEAILDTAWQWMRELQHRDEKLSPEQLRYRDALAGEGEHTPCHARVIYFALAGQENALTVLSETLPLSDGDALLPDSDGVLFVKSMAEIGDFEELSQFVRAVAETVEGETSLDALIGVGTETASTDDLSCSRDEAIRAVRLGKRYRREGNVFFFDRMLLERLLSEIPEETAKRFAACLQDKKTSRVLNEEMLLTVNTFFEKDLSVSDTARQLYIHRNTLLYRFDKLEKATGLDPRRFEDAVILKLLLEMKK